MIGLFLMLVLLFLNFGIWLWQTILKFSMHLTVMKSLSLCWNINMVVMEDMVSFLN